MRQVILLVLVLVLGLEVALVTFIWIGPLISGARSLTEATGRHSASHDLPASYRPRHKGHVDVSTGLYIREDEDLVLSRTPPFKFTRTYLSHDHVSRQFGVGTTNNAEWYLIGDPARFQWSELILADGGRIHFDRTSSGISFTNALFLHRATPTGFYGARLGWTGSDWVMRFYDGSFATFQACSPGGNNVCSLIEICDADGHRLFFRRDGGGRLVAIEGPFQRMTLAYDARNRIAKAQIDDGVRADYTYDEPGRLVGVRSSDGVIRNYTYGPRGEMLTIREPGWFIENTYDGDMRVVRQVTRLDPSPRDPHPEDAVIAFAYTTANHGVTSTDVTDYDGTHRVIRFNARHYADMEVHDARGANPIVLSIDRHADGQFATELTVRCSVNGRRITRSVPMTDGLSEEEAKDRLVAETCPAADNHGR